MPHRSGTPIWFELTTGDQDRAQDFYQDVAGWTVSTSPAPEHAGYRIATAPDGSGVAGIMKPPPGMKGLPGWMIYFASRDVDAMVDDVERLGGAVHFGPMDIPHVGRFATVSDPQGVPFMIMTGSSPEESTAFKQVAHGGEGGFGHAVWIELATPDPDGAIGFYGQLFGWEKKGAMPMGEMGDYTFIGTGEDFRPGAVMSTRTTGAPARWDWYINVRDIDAAVAAAKGKGGALLRGLDPIPGGDYSAKLADAEGHGFGVVGPRRSGEGR